MVCPVRQAVAHLRLCLLSLLRCHRHPSLPTTAVTVRRKYLYLLLSVFVRRLRRKSINDDINLTILSVRPVFVAKQRTVDAFATESIEKSQTSAT